MRKIDSGDLGWIVKTHERLYHEEAGFDASFGPVVREVVSDFLARHDPAREAGWMAEVSGARAGTLFVTSEAEAARLRLFLLLPALRGTGRGGEMLDLARDFAARAGYERLLVATYDRHRAAVRLYERSGFEETMRRPARAFGQEMVERHFALRLASQASGR